MGDCYPHRVENIAANPLCHFSVYGPSNSSRPSSLIIHPYKNPGYVKGKGTV